MFYLPILVNSVSQIKSLLLSNQKYGQGCYVGDAGLIALGQNCKLLEDLNLRFCEGLTDAGLIGFVQGCGSSLKSLGIAACVWISDISLQSVASHCKYLETLSLDSELIRNDGVISVAKCCHFLKSLKLQCVNISDEALLAVGSFCCSLEQLALFSFQRFTDRQYTLASYSIYSLPQVLALDILVCLLLIFNL